MKIMTRLSAAFAASIAFIISAHQASAQTPLYYWDPTGLSSSESSPYGDGGGTWDNVTYNWDLGPTGNTTTTLPAGEMINGTIPASSNQMTVASTAGLATGEYVYGPNIPAGDYITAISGNVLTLNAAIGSSADTGTTNQFVFGYAVQFGTSGNGGVVNLSTPQFVNSVTVTEPAYTFTGSQLTTATITDSSATGTVEFDNNITYGLNAGLSNSSLTVSVANGGTLYFNGGTLYSDNGYNMNNAAGSAYTGTINFNNVSLSALGGKYLAINNGTVNFTGTSTYLSNNGQLHLGSSGATTLNIGSSTNSTAVVNLGTVSGTVASGGSIANGSTLQIADGSYATVANVYGTLNTNKIVVNAAIPSPTSAVGSSGTLNLYAGGTVNDYNDLIVVNSGSTSTSQLATAVGVVNISGGTFNVASGHAVYLNEANNVTGTSATLNVSGGTMNVYGNYGIDFASGSTTAGTNSSILNLTGGTINLAGGGLHTGSYGATNTYSATATATDTEVNLGGGTMGALANWSSSMPITLTGTNGNVTFNTDADGSTNGYTITLNGLINGSGGLKKTGAGTLTITGAANTYSGPTLVSMGTLSLASAGTSNVEVAAGGTLQLSLFTSLATTATLSLDSTTLSFLALDFATPGTDTIASLIVGGTQVAAGTYSASQLNTMFSTTEFSGLTGDYITVVPEPRTWAMLFLGLGALVMLARRRRSSEL